LDFAPPERISLLANVQHVKRHFRMLHRQLSSVGQGSDGVRSSGHYRELIGKPSGIDDLVAFPLWFAIFQLQKLSEADNLTDCLAISFWQASSRLGVFI
jgi:hypothetical protein